MMQCVRGGSGGMPCDLQAKRSTVYKTLNASFFRRQPKLGQELR